ncbi:MAG: alpha/beta hydrolase [Myxococcales bacterium]|nr:alpha/beta hydrolase [Deltaproteobacteria bacterium]NND30270.1 alpha/beta hydrolase [Myxococcales bacterium]NNL23416.1 alpha/beta hydrolase [Myxococcales bacterium]
MHAVSRGKGPVVLFCHGFPGLWYSWRHQLPVIADAGFRAIAVDMRGYGRSDRPLDASEYGNQTIVADLVGVLDALGAEHAVVVGHDFGAQAAWAAALHAPERVRGVVSLAVPYGLGFAGDEKAQRKRGTAGKEATAKGRKPSETYAAIAKNHFLHLHYFQKPGPAEAELGSQPRLFLKRIYWALSARGSLLDFKSFPSEGTGYLDVLAEPEEPLPWPWLGEEDLDFLVAEYMQTGPETAFIGGLNSYRAMDLNWEHDPDYGRRAIEQPALFICGEKDPVLQLITPESLQTMPSRVTDLRGVEIIADAGHFVQQEQPETVNRHLLGFLKSLR